MGSTLRPKIKFCANFWDILTMSFCSHWVALSILNEQKKFNRHVFGNSTSKSTFSKNWKNGVNFETKNQILCQLLGHDHDVFLFTLSGSIDYKRTKKIQSSRLRQFNLKVDFFENWKNGVNFGTKNQILCQRLGHTHDVNMFTLSGSIDYKRTK